MIWFIHPVNVSDEALKDMDLLLITDGNNSHHVYIKILTASCTVRQNIGMKITFADIACNVLLKREY